MTACCCLIPLLPLPRASSSTPRSGAGCRRPSRAASPVAPMVAVVRAWRSSSAWPLLGRHGGHAPSSRRSSPGCRRARLQVPFALRLDPLSALMILVVTGIGTLIHLYSTGYMHEETDSEYARYFSYLNLFAAFMLVLVLGVELPGDVHRLGRRRALLVPAHRLLVTRSSRRPTPARRPSSSTASATSGSSSGCSLIFATFGTLDFQGVAAGAAARARRDARHRRHDDRHAAALRRRHRQVGAAAAATSGCRTRWKARRRSRRSSMRRRW